MSKILPLASSSNIYFSLKDDWDYADVIFVVRDLKDICGCDTHRVHYPDYTGYIPCIGSDDCPECKKGNKPQFYVGIPLLVIDHSDESCNNKLLFWVRSKRIINLLEKVISQYPNLSEHVFRITRHGMIGDIHTSYEITRIQSNTLMSFDDILSTFNFKHYSDIYDKVFNAYYDEPENLSVAHKLIPQRFSYNCPNCGGAVRFMGNCEYCGTLILDKELSSAYAIR